jgi:hypothetical protein
MNIPRSRKYRPGAHTKKPFRLPPLCGEGWGGGFLVASRFDTLENLSMFGAMLFIIANGDGVMSVDAKRATKPPA